MKIVVAMDSLKGSLTSLEAGHAVREGALRADPAARVAVRLPAQVPWTMPMPWARAA